MARPKPARPNREGEPRMLTQIRDAVRDDGRTLSQIAETCGLDAGRLSRFVRGERDLSLGAAARLCEAIGLTLVPALPVVDAVEMPKRGWKPKAVGKPAAKRKRSKSGEA